MSSFTINFKAALVRQGLENLSEAIPKVGTQRIYFRMLRIKTRLSQPAPKPNYPIQWDSERQKRAYFASDGFGKGIPYKRDGGTENAWTLQGFENGYRLANESPGGFFVFGDMFQRKGQSRIHAGRWPLTRVVAFEELDQLPQEIQADIQEAKKQSGF